ncbi:MAG: FtsW/RodA/SpoVE family cell cycle protein [Gemmatimonadota bacterium]|nr:FtsW/RodA/SpoVE family cell cycle protein [Gemmatimonadota bacterium]
MSPRPVDIEPAGLVQLPESGLGKGWEATAVFGLTVLLLSLGLVFMYSASSVLALRQGLPDTHYVLRQSAGAGFGVGLLMACAFIPYRLWEKCAWVLLGLSVTGLVLVVLPWTEAIAPEVNGARRWLRIGFSVQPSEIAKIAVVVWTAAMAVKKKDQFKSLRQGLGPFLLVWGVVIVLIILEPDLSTALVIGALGAVIVFAAGARLSHFIFLAALGAPLVWRQFAVGFRAERIEAFLNPASDPAGAGYQVHQSLVALGSGGLSGLGIGEGRQKFGFLPEAHNDFIFAMIGEEWGFLGVLLVVVLYTLIVLVGFRIASRAPDAFGELLAIGCSSLIALQAFLHMAVGLALAPPTGLSLPLVSFGRSNLVMTLVALGILISVARAAPGGKAAYA